MNKTLIAAAVSAAVVIPVTASAASVYGRIQNAITVMDSGEGSSTNMTGGGSRFGFKVSTALGNGMTASGHYEFATITDEAEEAAGLGLRLGTVGLSGSFGGVTLGNQWSSFFNTVGTHIDITRHSGAAGTGFLPYRTGNTIKYANSVGPLSLELDLRVDDAGMGDGAGLGISVAVNNNLTLAAAFDSAGNPDRSVETSAAVEAVMASDAMLGTRVVGNDSNLAYTYYLVNADDEQVTISLDSGSRNLFTRSVDNTTGAVTYNPVEDVTSANAGETFYIAPDVGTTAPTDDTAVAVTLPGALPEALTGEAPASGTNPIGTEFTPKVDEVMGMDAVTAMVPDEDADRVGLAARVNFGSMFGTLGWIKKEHGPVEISATQLWLGSDVGGSTRVFVGYGREDYNMAAVAAANKEKVTTGENPSKVAAGVHHELGGGLSVAYEGSSVDNDVEGMDNTSKHVFSMRYNF